MGVDPTVPRAAAMESTIASLRRQARIQRALIFAIFLVASQQFFLQHDPSIQRHAAAIHSFHRGLKDWSRSPRRAAKGGGSGGGRNNTHTAGYATSSAAFIINSTIPKVDSGSYHVGEFCQYCSYSDNALCEDRVSFLMKKYHLSEEQAMENQAVKEKCMAPPIYHRVYAAEEEEPYLYFHGGPHKTGTTALQTFIYDLKWQNETLFLKDNLRVPSYDELPGGFGKEGVGLNLCHCSITDYKEGGGQVNIGQCDPMRKAFPRFLQDAWNKSQNILIVAEDFDQLGIDFKRMRFFLRPYNKIKFAVTYRRLHEWLPSFYQNIVAHWTRVYARGEARFPSYVEWLGENYDKFLKMHAGGVADRFRAFDIVESVDILNIHAAPNLIEYYFCNHLRAENVCQAIKEGAKPSKTNVGADHEYERLAIEANNRKPLTLKYNMHIEVQRSRAARYLKQEVEKMGVDKMPMVCPPKEMLDNMLAKEMEQERTAFPKWYESQGGDEGLRKSFDAAVQKKFCAFDLEKVFEEGLLDHVLWKS